MFFWSKLKLPSRTIDDIKKICRVLFVDDQKFDTVEIISKSGWNVERVKDIDAIDSPVVRNSHIFFIDIKGVGRAMKFSDDGLGLVSAIKERYPEKKVVIYSSVSEGNRFHQALKKADDLLSKNADPYEFQTTLEKLSKEVFDVDECLPIIRAKLRDEFGVSINIEDLRKSIDKLYKTQPINNEHVAKVLGIAIDKAGALASIISLLIQKK